MTATAAFADEVAPPQPDYSEIDRLALRTVVTIPGTAGTLFGDMDGFKEILADHGFGLFGLATVNLEDQINGLPTSTKGQQRYIGQRPEFDTSASYIALTYDLGRIGMTDGLVTLQGCGAYSTYKNAYPTGGRFCAAYIDQPLFDKKFDIQAGIISNSNQYANPLVGGSVAAGSLGPSASILTEMGLAAGGEGAPAINLTGYFWDGFYDRAGVQRSTSPQGYVYDGLTANPIGLNFTEDRANVLALDEFGYRHSATAGSPYSWFRIGGMRNDSSFTRYLDGRYQAAEGLYVLLDQQFLQIDPEAPGRGFYAGASYMQASSAIFSYPAYYEARLYGIGVIPGRPKDQLTLVSDITDVSSQYRASLEKKGYDVHDRVYNTTLAYNYRIIPGLSVNAGLSYGINPSVIYTSDEGHPLLARLSISAYF